MRILFLAHDDISSGSGRSLFEMVVGLKNFYNIVPVVITKKKNALYKACLGHDIECYRLRFGMCATFSQSIWMFLLTFFADHFNNRRAYWKIKKMLDLSAIDLIHSNSSVISFGAFLANKTGIPHVWHIREFGDSDFHIHYSIQNMAQYISANANQVIAVSDVVKNHWVTRGIEANRVVVLYDGISKEMPMKISKKKSNNEVLSCVFCGWIDSPKRQRLAIDALALLPLDVRTCIHLDFYGFGNSVYLEQLERVIQRKHLQKNVHFCGYSENLDRILCTYDVGLNCSRMEGYGRVTVEYMLAGLCVIASDSGANSELIQHEKTGLLFRSGDAADLSKQLLKLYSDRQLSNRLSLAGNRWAHENASFNVEIKGLYSLYGKIMATNSSVTEEALNGQ